MKITDNFNNFESMLKECKELKDQQKLMEKQTNTLVKNIKDQFMLQGIEEYNIPGVLKASCKKTVSTRINENKLIDILINMSNQQTSPETAERIKSCIEYVPTINETKVQDLIYEGIISTEDIEPATVESTITRLTFSKSK